jgi:hypothetical protein
MTDDEKAKKLLTGEGFTIAIVGSRSFIFNPKNSRIVNNFILEHMEPDQIGAVVSGGAQGADQQAHVIGEYYDVPTADFLPDWKGHGKRAGFIRNRKIVENSDIIFAFWDGKSRGTRHTLKLAKEMGKEFHIYHFESKDN